MQGGVTVLGRIFKTSITPQESKFDDVRNVEVRLGSSEVSAAIVRVCMNAYVETIECV